MAQSNDNGQSNNEGKLSAADLGQAALTTVEELTGYEPEAVTALTWDGDFWQITVDVLELARIPNTTDVLGSYVVQLDQGGTLHGYRRARRLLRGPPGGGGSWTPAPCPHKRRSRRPGAPSRRPISPTSPSASSTKASSSPAASRS